MGTVFEGVVLGIMNLGTVYLGVIFVVVGRMAARQLKRKWKAVGVAGVVALALACALSINRNDPDATWVTSKEALKGGTRVWMFCFGCMLTGIFKPDPIDVDSVGSED